MHINKLVVAIRNGWIKPDQRKKQPEEENLWDLWENVADDELALKMPPAIAAPKLKLPGHAESYNPSEEYLFTEVNFLWYNLSKFLKRRNLKNGKKMILRIVYKISFPRNTIA